MIERLHLSPRHCEEIEALLHKHLPDVEVWAYGSRVNGRSHDGSDLDLVLRGPKLAEIDTSRIVDFIEALQDSTIPFLVEARDWARLPESFHREIKHAHVVLAAGDDERIAGRSLGVVGETIADFVDIVMGQSPPGGTVSGGVGLPLLNGPTEFGPHHPTPIQFTTDARKIAHPGDLLFCVRGSTTGRMNWADQEYAIGRGVAAIRHRCASELQPFVRAVLAFELPELLVQATGSTFPNVSASQLSSIPYPSLSATEQRAIAHILGTLDDKIELNRRMNKTLEAMARALFKSWFVDFDPVRAKMAGRDTGLPKHLADFFPDRLVESELGEIPEGWKIGTVSQLAERIQNGGTPKRSEPTYWERGEIPWLISSEVRQSFVLGTQNFISEKGLEKSSAKMVPARSILVALYGATAGQVSMNYRPLSTNQAVTAVIPSMGNRYFCLVGLKLEVSALENRAVGSAQQNISKKVVEETIVLLPQIELRSAYDVLVESLFDRIFYSLHETQTLSDLRAALLPKLISGALRVEHTSNQ